MRTFMIFINMTLRGAINTTSNPRQEWRLMGKTEAEVGWGGEKSKAQELLIKSLLQGHHSFSMRETGRCQSGRNPQKRHERKTTCSHKNT